MVSCLQVGSKKSEKIVMGPFERPVGQNFVKEIIRKTLYRHVDAILCSGYKTVDYYTNKSKHVYLFGYAADIDRELPTLPVTLETL